MNQICLSFSLPPPLYLALSMSLSIVSHIVFVRYSITCAAMCSDYDVFGIAVRVRQQYQFLKSRRVSGQAKLRKRLYGRMIHHRLTRTGGIRAQKGTL